MKKIVILGCENSHADAFLNNIKTKPDEFSDVEVIGVYSHEREAAEKLNAKFGVPVMDDYTDGVGKVDGVIITARHGDRHYAYAKPYLDSGVPMFVDKPITISEDEAVEFMRALKAKNTPVCGGSSLRQAFQIRELKIAHAEQEGGRTVGGSVRAPLSSVNDHGGFFFYSQHLVEMVLEPFGRYPKAVQVSIDDKKNRTVQFFYGDYTVTGLYTEGGNEYFAARYALNSSQGGYIHAIALQNWYYSEFKEFVGLLRGEGQPMSYSDFIAPVFVLNAIDRASTSGKVEPIQYVEV